MSCKNFFHKFVLRTMIKVFNEYVLSSLSRSIFHNRRLWVLGEWIIFKLFWIFFGRSFSRNSVRNILKAFEKMTYCLLMNKRITYNFALLLKLILHYFCFFSRISWEETMCRVKIQREGLINYIYESRASEPREALDCYQFSK